MTIEINCSQRIIHSGYLSAFGSYWCAITFVSIFCIGTFSPGTVSSATSRMDQNGACDSRYNLAKTSASNLRVDNEPSGSTTNSRKPVNSSGNEPDLDK